MCMDMLNAFFTQNPSQIKALGNHDKVFKKHAGSTVSDNFPYSQKRLARLQEERLECSQKHLQVEEGNLQSLFYQLFGSMVSNLFLRPQRCNP